MLKLRRPIIKKPTKKKPTTAIKKKKPATPLKTKLKIAVATGVIGASLLTGSIAKNKTVNISKNINTKTVNVYHVTKPSYPQGKEKVIKVKLSTLNKKSKPNEIYFWDSKVQKINKINLDPIRMGNIFRILEYKTQIVEIEKVLREAGGQIWEKQFINKPIKEVYSDLTPNQIQKIEKVVKTIPNENLQYIQRESKMVGDIIGAGTGIATGLILSSYLAKSKLFKKRKTIKKK